MVEVGNLTKREKRDALYELTQEIDSHACHQEPCKKCRNYVHGEGDPDATVVFVGEAPGEQEDRQGVPFVGRSGVLLDSLLKRAGLGRKDVFITNVLKARPPSNRDPTPEEVEHHSEWLANQIEIIEPELIVTLGRFALEFFVPGHRISDVHGLLLIDQWRRSTVAPWFHPSAGLRDQKVKDQMVKDAAMLGRYVNEFI